MLANSEGCIHALNYQTQAAAPFAGLVLTSAFARSTGTLARSQIAAQFAAVPGGEQLLAAYDAATCPAPRPDLRAGQDRDQVRQALHGVVLNATLP